MAWVFFTALSSFGQTVIDVNTCSLPYTYQYDSPESADSVNWDLEAGEAAFTQSENSLVFSAAEDGAILTRSVYNDGEFSSSAYILNVIGACDLTQAHVGNSHVEKTACDFPFNHFPETYSQSGEEAKWEVIDGAAEFEVTDGHLYITDASPSVAFVYSITNSTETTYDTMYLDVTEGDGCIGINSGLNDNVVTCNTESAVIYAMIDSVVIESGYVYKWSTASGGVSITSPGSANTTFKIKSSGEKVIQLNVYTKLGSHVGESKITFGSTCDNEGYLVEGTVKALGEKWGNGKIYLIDATQDIKSQLKNI